jgi:hypothetical protein
VDREFGGLPIKDDLNRKEKQAFAEKKRERVRYLLLGYIREAYGRFPKCDGEMAMRFAEERMEHVIQQDPSIRNIVQQAAMGLIKNLSQFYK